MTPVDELIRDALNEEDADWSKELEAQSVPEIVIASFKGRYRTFVIAVYIALVLFGVLTIASAVRFFSVSELPAQITWGVSCLFCAQTVGLLKVWYWMELNRIAMTREIKRFQLQLTRLSQHQGNSLEEMPQA